MTNTAPPEVDSDLIRRLFFKSQFMTESPCSFGYLLPFLVKEKYEENIVKVESCFPPIDKLKYKCQKLLTSL